MKRQGGEISREKERTAGSQSHAANTQDACTKRGAPGELWGRGEQEFRYETGAGHQAEAIKQEGEDVRGLKA